MEKAKTIQHGKDEENAYCRTCNFRLLGRKDGTLENAKRHNKLTNHTVDVYYETWREITNNWQSPSTKTKLK